jgi:hypothetical protein
MNSTIVQLQFIYNMYTAIWSREISAEAEKCLAVILIIALRCTPDQFMKSETLYFSHAALQIVIFIAFNKRKSKDSMKLPKSAELQYFFCIRTHHDRIYWPNNLRFGTLKFFNRQNHGFRGARTHEKKSFIICDKFCSLREAADCLCRGLISTTINLQLIQAAVP